MLGVGLEVHIGDSATLFSESRHDCSMRAAMDHEFVDTGAMYLLLHASHGRIQ